MTICVDCEVEIDEYTDENDEHYLDYCDECADDDDVLSHLTEQQEKAITDFIARDGKALN